MAVLLSTGLFLYISGIMACVITPDCCDEHVYLCVCPQAYLQNYAIFVQCMLSTAMAQSSSGSIVMCKLCVKGTLSKNQSGTRGRHGSDTMAYTQTDTLGAALDLGWSLISTSALFCLLFDVILLVSYICLVSS